ncbi:hypothetical protein EDB84DRAFT_1565191 [Lactarius hengduanensis]|nr:hypothetical protein EDB84DRAFT_1565191 [Lactarius hengduanensis]
MSICCMTPQTDPLRFFLPVRAPARGGARTHIASLHVAVSADFLPTSALSAPVLPYKKVAREVHPVAVSLPEDVHIDRRRLEDPRLSLPALSTHLPESTPSAHLTQERLDGLDPCLDPNEYG